ncbi:MAG: glucose/mannose-6-phosphate isomerase [Flavobacteriales bacterium]|jgi:glucose/mannose-6-phosphate isomerase
MEKLIAAFPSHLETAMEIGRKSNFAAPKNTVKNVLIIGLGGSGIGGSIVTQIISGEISVPVNSLKSYFIPNWVDENTLVICCSYSGNTEETLIALEQAIKKGAEVAAITSGGTLLDICKKNKLNHIVIPGGEPPRTMLGFSMTSLFFVFANYGLISNRFITSFEQAITLIKTQSQEIKDEAKALAKKLLGTTPVLYAANPYEGVLVRWRQQINENAKMLCWHHVIPEMNHNELVGWRDKNNNLAVVILRNSGDYERIQKRIEINKEIISKYTSNITEVYSKGDDMISNSLYLIHLGDWLSLYLSDMKEMDPIEVTVIDYLKSQLSNF